jgi:hypothetical protein
MSAHNLTSSLRKQGPITTGVSSYERRLPTCFNETTRRMGPCFRRDDAVRCGRSRHTRLSSPGLTGRPSTPWPLGSFAAALEYWIPAFEPVKKSSQFPANCDSLEFQSAAVFKG